MKYCEVVRRQFSFNKSFIIRGKYYIFFSKKCQNSLPTAQGSIARIKLTYRIELQIAIEKKYAFITFYQMKKSC